MAFNRLDGNLDAFAAALPPPRKTSIQQEPIPTTIASKTGGRKLAAFASAAHTESSGSVAAAVDPAAASLALAKKLMGTREDWSVLQPGQDLQQYFTLDSEALEAIATGHAHVAGRRLAQAASSIPAPGGATTSTVTRPAVPSGVCV